MKGKKAPALIYRIWFKIFLVLLTFLPLITQKPYDPRTQTPVVIAEVLKNPLIVQIRAFLPLAKALLLLVVIAAFVMCRSEKVVLGYYTLILIPVAFLQNMAHTSFGFSVIVGNIVVQCLVIILCLLDLMKNASMIERTELDKSKLWVFPLMLLAFFMPYEFRDGRLVASMKTILTNEAGVTYCMITPVIEGLLILFHKKVHKPTLHAISFAGMIFAVWNMITWFGLDLANWWMGFLHLPLLILSLAGLILSRNIRRRRERLG